MKREYILMIFIVVAVALLFTLEHFLGKEIIMQNCYRFIVFFLIIAYVVGQFSMKFPKA